MDDSQARAITAPHAMAAHAKAQARRRLERDLDAADEAHRETVAARLAVSRYAPELDADVSELQSLAELLAAASRRAAVHLSTLAENNLSVPDRAPGADRHDIADRIEESLEGLLTPTAAALLAAALQLELA